MRMLLTGITGFLGRAIAARAVSVGLEVRGICRNTSRDDSTTGVELVQADLRTSDLSNALADVDVVVHAAAAAPWTDTVEMTRRVLAAMRSAATPKLVLVSSMAVLDYRALRSGDEVSEQSPMETSPRDRDGYARAKLEQEHLARECAAGGGRLSIVRPGAVVAPANVWTPRLGFQIGGRRWVQVGREAMLPLVHIDACAAAIVEIARRDDPPPVVHVINDRPPAQRAYVSAMVARGWLPRPVATVGYRAVRAIASGTWPAMRILPLVRRRVPGALVPCRLDARFKPLRYSTALGRSLMGSMSDRSALELLGA